MVSLQIEVKLLSETIFGCGENVCNSVNIEVLQDELGIPYMKGKTFKGKLREEVDAVAKLIESYTYKSYKDEVDALFGKEGKYSEDGSRVLDILKFSNCEISTNIRKVLNEAVKEKIVSKEELLGSFTEIRSFTSIDENGIAKQDTDKGGSLRQSRVIKKNTKYYVELNIGRNLTDIEKGLLASGVESLRNIGTMESRGKGRVQCELLENGECVTLNYIKMLEKAVN